MTALRLQSREPLDGFVVPAELNANEPAEMRGLQRDEVRLMVVANFGIGHQSFVDIADLLSPGDLIVVNNSATLPAAVAVDNELVLHFSTPIPAGGYAVEPRLAAGHGTKEWTGDVPTRFDLPGGSSVEIIAPYPIGASSDRLWMADFRSELPLKRYLGRWGHPIRYAHIDEPLPISAYQTVFSTVSGSAEMPSASRPFSGRVLASLAARGIAVAPITLHAGVSSLEAGEKPSQEWLRVPESTARLINNTRRAESRVVASGTTVVRALESAVDSQGLIHPAAFWTDLFIESDHSMRSVDGLITGWHEPMSTHLAMLESLIGSSLLSDAYQEALSEGYLWHEFGDSALLLAR